MDKRTDWRYAARIGNEANSRDSSVRFRAVRATVISIVVYAVCWIGARVFGERAGFGVMLCQWMFDGALVVVSLLIWRATGRPWSEFGIRRPLSKSIRWRWYAWACTLMLPASIGAVLLGVSHPMLKAMTPLQAIVSAWVIGSIAEETFVRGLVQSFVYARGSVEQVGHIDIVVSSLVFSGMHIGLLWSGMSLVGVCIIMATTACVGAIAAIARRRTGSLLHCVGIHSAANVAGVVFGGLLTALR